MLTPSPGGSGNPLAHVQIIANVILGSTENIYDAIVIAYMLF